ncbi:UDP-N-acetylmuramoyl-L-alanyl-D-glutamate--2,6-diaminopimelate ligase [Nodosilinea sp. LEGE 07298]|uniref:UDP-N-acetylmuramoyl-L-alanyl-D-glutamate--2, 6-diaminopimelate ligase n=1 Tax=Nodosilinea sp. LEGE 07298 TaxID=2777970 RepID=UPI001881356C|nr:UDP-N-acetylmuramoyl-L-alanyl-D-glutamate--2,6-diaminopimelate ligase [Nodosilinea sp. LEGE 07298]MBE9110125.1 UDP-N-acetylmuramoyl-L-alanyl-D-glutamate--2,6-diaminopimelate ligase [Nodosilinea sp. LEGE 07298]
MKLRQLLEGLPTGLIETGFSLPMQDSDPDIKGLCTNSHACQSGDVFIGMPGTRVDGGEFWPSAMESGAAAALVSTQALQARPVENDACVVPMTDMSVACAEVAARFYNYPARQMGLVGVTGTNGKTTTTHLVEHLLNASQQPTALLGTLYTRWPGHQQTALYTTPFAVELQAELAKARDAGCRFAVLEVSSHALAQKRVWGCPFEVAVFTNLTQDHLDYHRDMEDYFQAKALLFSEAYLAGRAVVNIDTPYGDRLVAQLPTDRVWTYSTQNSNADLYTGDLTYQANGVTGTLKTPMGTVPFSSPLVGQFNLENLLAAVGAALHLGVSLNTIAAALPGFGGVPGRMEQVKVADSQDISVIVDYAHTPDSLKNSLTAARPFVPGRLICVFGCGGDRDRTKRPQMGRIAHELADAVVVTSDNPRTEDPEQILRDVVAGIPAELGADQVVGDRATAIQSAIAMAQPGDGILIAGKGHEDYQILGTEKIHFDDREQARHFLEKRYIS